MELVNSLHIADGDIILNNKLITSYSPSSNWKKDLYNQLEINYPKFHKMDNLSKMVILAMEIIVSKSENGIPFKEENVSLVFANLNSSSKTDVKFIETCEKGSPSPSLFVYTLPNICMGELCIKNKWYGENTFLIQNNFDLSELENEAEMFLKKGAKWSVIAWVEDYEKEECKMFIYKK
jgi:hypothetical protein